MAEGLILTRPRSPCSRVAREACEVVVHLEPQHRKHGHFTSWGHIDRHPHKENLFGLVCADPAAYFRAPQGDPRAP
ncbi:Hypothetical protein NTJ_01260 [Nesidiocoris tenuis]|uniref:Uncharacterized protein n=1 Tax=Nesidiocoris tenuis TaxID=355587 RepID=A0ABN7ABF9_9HEMI|nr:Hypothetical protein NTJ_01260 [Nesidiocoris tenuis]